MLLTKLCLQSFAIFMYSGYELLDKKLVNVISGFVGCLHPVVLCCAELFNLIKSYLSVLAILSWVWLYLFRKSLPATSVWKCCPYNIFLVISGYEVLHLGIWSISCLYIYLSINLSSLCVHVCVHVHTTYEQLLASWCGKRNSSKLLVGM